MKHKSNSLLKLGYAPLAVYAEFDRKYAQNLKTRSEEKLAELDDVEIVSWKDLIISETDLRKAIQTFKEAEIDVLILQTATFPNGSIGVQLAEAMKVPIILWAVREPHMKGTLPLNSLCGVNLLSHPLSKLGLTYKFLYANPEDQKFLRELKSYLVAVKVSKQLSDVKVGLIGSRAPGFYASNFDELLLKRQFGVQISNIPISALFKILNGISKKEAVNTLKGEKFQTAAGDLLNDEIVLNIKRNYLGLKKMVSDRKLNAIAIRDWPELLGEDWYKGKESGVGRIWPALGYLHDSGVSVGYEGDMNASISMCILRYLTNQTPFFADIIEFTPEENKLLLWHYGAAPSLANEPSMVSYTQVGYEFHFNLKPGICTLARLEAQEDTHRMLIAKGKALPTEIPLHRASVYVKLEGSVRELMDTIIYDGWGHHYCLAYGDCSTELIEFCKVKGIKAVEIR